MWYGLESWAPSPMMCAFPFAFYLAHFMKRAHHYGDLRTRNRCALAVAAAAATGIIAEWLGSIGVRPVLLVDGCVLAACLAIVTWCGRKGDNAARSTGMDRAPTGHDGRGRGAR